MGTEIKVPKIVGASRLSVGRWFKSVGDPVSLGEPVTSLLANVSPFPHPE
jgi:hypothetical protein